ncbi:MAG: hypothetical protein IKO29_02885 [Bacteroidales bacterium]|nr:hypothetical protein [Bacteroidales bacterium]
MTDPVSPEISYLKEEVAKRFGGRIETSTDFDALQEAIAESLQETVSAATLKRLWGYVSKHPRQRLSTLNLLARYTGRKDFRTLCLELQQTSDFFSAHTVRSQEVEAGCHVALRWHPDRVVVFRALGGGLFEVEDAGRSKLCKGDRVEALEFIQGQPLYLSVERDGKRLRPYVAGRARGITGIEVY